MHVPRSAVACAAAVGLLAILPGAALARHSPKAKPLGTYAQRNLVSDQAGKAEMTDPNLLNAWGLAFGPATPAWVADNGTGKATLYSGAKSPTDPVAIVPRVFDVSDAPTGQVFNGSSGFMVAGAPAFFMFSTEAGKITAWQPGLGTTAQTVASVKKAIFKGLAISGNRIYAADFHHGKVDVWDDSFARVKKRGAFVDRRLPRRFAPFGIQAVGNRIVVTYAKQDKKAEDEIDKKGLGFVDVYSRTGRLVKRFAKRGALNAPWGVVQAPQGFGAASGAMLIGNFGDGRILAFKRNGKKLGELAGANGKPLVIDGLWALKFGNGVIGTPTSLLFTAGPGDESHGLFGLLNAM